MKGDGHKRAPRITPERRGEDGLTPEERIFCAEYVRLDHGANAYAAAFPVSRRWKLKTRHEAASRLRAQPEIAARIAEIARAANEQAQAAAAPAEAAALADASATILSALRAMLLDPARCLGPDGLPLPLQGWPEDVRLAIDRIEYGCTEAGVVFVKRVAFSSRTQAREQLMKHFGQFEADNRQRNPLEKMSDAELRREAERYARALGFGPIAEGHGEPAVADKPDLVH